MTKFEVSDDKYMMILFGGESNTEDAALLGSKRMKSLIHAFEQQADIVILDTAPAELLAACVSNGEICRCSTVCRAL